MSLAYDEQSHSQLSDLPQLHSGLAPRRQIHLPNHAKNADLVAGLGRIGARPKEVSLPITDVPDEGLNRRSSAAVKELSKITSMVNKARSELPAYQFLTAFPQIVSRIGHPKKEISGLLRKVMALVIQKFPQQAMWPTVGVMQSNRADRKQACLEVVQRAQVRLPHIRIEPTSLTTAN